MRVRGIFGILFCLAGAVWLAQGVGAMHGSSMTGHSQYAVLGGAVIVLGLALLVWANHVRRNRVSEPS